MKKMLGVAFALIIFIGCNDKNSNGQEVTDNSKKTENTMQTPADSMVVGIIKTKHGDIEIELYTNDAPKTTKNFIELSLKDYYDGVIFHRIAKNFVIQGGDPTGTGSGGESIYGETFEDELNPNTKSYQAGYLKGVVAMANRGPNTNTSQFFIMLQDNNRLPKNYTIFGKVVKGMDVVEKIAAAEIIPQMGPTDGRPVDPVEMQDVVIETRARDANDMFQVK